MREFRDELDIPLWKVERVWLRHLAVCIWFFPVLFFNMAGYIALSLTMTIRYTFVPIWYGNEPSHRERIDKVLE